MLPDRLPGLPIRQAQRKELDWRAFRLRSAKVEDCSLLVDQPCVVTENGRVKVVYLHPPAEEPGLAEVYDACDHIRYDTSQRTTGMTSTSRVFGYEPRKTLRKDFCGATSLASESPVAHDKFVAAARICERYYRAYNPDLFKLHAEQARNRVLARYHLHNTVFTSGIINNNNPLPYHFDSGNFASVWSAMLVFKRDVAGGYLACPQYDMAFALPHNSLLMFDGQSLLHGVTPIEKLNENAKRYSIVFYSLRGMWSCLTPAEEEERIRRVKTERERRRAGLPPFEVTS